MRPTLKIGDRLIVWDAGSRHIVKHGEWTYTITEPDEKYPLDNAAIGRKNAKGQTEFWHRDGRNGQEITQGVDGVRKIRTWFTSGILAGKVRKAVEVAGEKTATIYRAAYDENGRLLRDMMVLNGQTTVRHFNGRGKPERQKLTYPDGTFAEYTYNEAGLVTSRRDTNSHAWEYTYSNQGLLIAVPMNGKTLWRQESR